MPQRSNFVFCQDTIACVFAHELASSDTTRLARLRDGRAQLAEQVT
jgi:hypothetical protein